MADWLLCSRLATATIFGFSPFGQVWYEITLSEGTQANVAPPPVKRDAASGQSSSRAHGQDVVQPARFASSQCAGCNFISNISSLAACGAVANASVLRTTATVPIYMVKPYVHVQYVVLCTALWSSCCAAIKCIDRQSRNCSSSPCGWCTMHASDLVVSSLMQQYRCQFAASCQPHWACCSTDDLYGIQ